MILDFFLCIFEFQPEWTHNSKRRRLNDKTVAESVQQIQLPRNQRKQLPITNFPITPSAKNYLKISIDEDEIDEIIGIGKQLNECMFKFKRNNGEFGIIPVKVANIKYPDAVLDFYEKTIILTD